MRPKIPLLIFAILGIGILIFAIVMTKFPFSIAPDKPNNNTIELNRLSWQKATENTPWETRDAHSAFLFKNRLWLTSGLNGNSVVNDKYVEYWKAEHKNDLWVSDNGLSWNEIKTENIWPPRRSLSIVEFKNKLWMLGGWSNINGYKSDVWSSEDGINWTKITDRASFPPREGQVLRTFKNKMWMMGGVNFDERKSKNDIWYSDDGAVWQEATSSTPWSPRYDHDVIVFKDKIWLLGGTELGGIGNSEVWVSDNGKDWSKITDSAPWGPRHGHIVVDYKNKMWVIGGWDLNTY